MSGVSRQTTSPGKFSLVLSMFRHEPTKKMTSAYLRTERRRRVRTRMQRRRGMRGEKEGWGSEEEE